MTDIEFKNIADNNKAEPMKLCFEVYFQEVKGNRVSQGDFEHLFQIWLMMNGGMNRVIEDLKKKYNYGL